MGEPTISPPIDDAEFAPILVSRYNEIQQRITNSQNEITRIQRENSCCRIIVFGLVIASFVIGFGQRRD